MHKLFEKGERERDRIDCGKFKPINLCTFTHTPNTITKPICCVLYITCVCTRAWYHGVFTIIIPNKLECTFNVWTVNLLDCERTHTHTHAHIYAKHAQSCNRFFCLAHFHGVVADEFIRFNWLVFLGTNPGKMRSQISVNSVCIRVPSWFSVHHRFVGAELIWVQICHRLQIYN